jgi:hypothetical protein
LNNGTIENDFFVRLERKFQRHCYAPAAHMA